MTISTDFARPGEPNPASLVAVTALVARVTGADALEVRAGVGHLDLGDEVLGTISVDMLVAHTRAAGLLASRLGLAERTGHHSVREHGLARLCWHGWLAGARWDLPVSLHLTTLDR